MENSSTMERSRLHNLFQTLAILAGMCSLFGLLGWMLFGLAGLIWSLFMAAILIATSPKITPGVVLRMYGARELSPQQVPGLHKVASEISHRAGLPAVPRLYHVPSRVMNAFSVGSRGNSAIALSDGLIRVLNYREITGVIAHEIGHISNNDLKIHAFADMMTRVTSLFSFLGQALLLLYLPMLFLSSVRVPLLFIVLLIFAPTLSTLLQLALSRTREFAADSYAVKYTGDPAGLASALLKMDTYEKKLWNIFMAPGRKVPGPSILRTHPHTRERVDRLVRLEGPGEPRASDLPHEIILPREIPEVRDIPRWNWFRPWY